MTRDERDEALRQRVLAALDEPAGWPREASEAYADDVGWQCPARGLQLRGRDAALARLQADALHLSGTRPVTLRHAVAGERAIHESAVALTIPPGGIDGLPLPPGTRVELGCTRLLTVRDGRVVEERVLETWTPLPG